MTGGFSSPMADKKAQFTPGLQCLNAGKRCYNSNVHFFVMMYEPTVKHLYLISLKHIGPNVLWFVQMHVAK